MSADGVKKFIAAIDLVFPAPQFDGDRARQAAWVTLMTKTLGGCSDDVLAEAAADILRNRDPKKDGRFFPVPKDCVEACEEAAQRLNRDKAPLLIGKDEMPYEARVKLARDLMQSPAGKQAIREGWGTSMYHFCVEHRRAPQGKDIDACKREAREFSATYERLVKGEHPLAGPLARLAEGMVRKAKDLMEKAA